MTSAVLARALPRRLAVLVAAAGIALTGFAATGASPAKATTSPTPAATAIGFAMAQLGKPYSWGATGPSSYDCSGLTSSAYRAAGITIPRVSRDQYRLLPKVSRPNWRPGDLIFYAWDTHDASSIHHVAVFLGDGWMLDAPHTGTVVQIRPVHSGLMYYGVRPAGRTSTMLLNIAPTTTGGAVRDLQTRLRSNGYQLPVTGAYDDATAAAVSDVRATYGLPTASSVGWRVWHALIVNGRHMSLP